MTQFFKSIIFLLICINSFSLLTSEEKEVASDQTVINHEKKNPNVSIAYLIPKDL